MPVAWTLSVALQVSRSIFPSTPVPLRRFHLDCEVPPLNLFDHYVLSWESTVGTAHSFTHRSRQAGQAVFQHVGDEQRFMFDCSAEQQHLLRAVQGDISVPEWETLDTWETLACHVSGIGPNWARNQQTNSQTLVVATAPAAKHASY